MMLYADVGGRRTGQLGGDLLLALWVVVWIWLGLSVYDSVAELADIGTGVAQGAGDLAGNLDEAGETAARVPLVGEELRSPLHGSAGAARTIADAGRDQQEAVTRLAVLLGSVVALVPIVLGAYLWMPRRVAFVRRATAARRHLDASAGLDLLALRALTTQPLRRLDRIADDPVRAWRDGDDDIVRRLAALELRDVGLRLPDHAVPADDRRGTTAVTRA